jgi:hypothetical protein
MLAAVRAARTHGKKVGRQIRAQAVAERREGGLFAPWYGLDVTPAFATPEAAAAAAAAAGAGMTTNILNPAFMQAGLAAVGSNTSSAPSQGLAWNRTAAAAAGDVGVVAAGVADRNISAAFFGGGGWNTNNNLWQGWGMNYYYFDYYQWWREHYFLRNMYMNLRIPPKVNPCK